MNNKVFEFYRKDIPFIKKDTAFRLIFVGLFLLIFIWQLISFVTQLASKNHSLGLFISSTVTLIVCLLFSSISILYALKNLRTVSAIKHKGKCTSSVMILHNIKKDSFIKLYSIVTEILALVISLVLICCITYGFLEMSYYSSISFYMPLLLVICLTGYYSMFHIQNEIKLLKTVEEFNRY